MWGIGLIQILSGKNSIVQGINSLNCAEQTKQNKTCASRPNDVESSGVFFCDGFDNMAQFDSEIATFFASAGNLSENFCHDTLDLMRKAEINFAEIFLQKIETESWSLDDSVIKAATHASVNGVGVRAVKGDSTGYSSIDSFEPSLIREGAKKAIQIASCGSKSSLLLRKDSKIPIQTLYSSRSPFRGCTGDQKAELLHHLDSYTRSLDKRIIKVSIGLAGSDESVLILGTDETRSCDRRPMAKLVISVVADESGEIASGSASLGGRKGLLDLFDLANLEKNCRLAVEEALVTLRAKPAPGGMMSIILGPGWPGIIFHEAVGHGLEGDFNRKGSSAFTGRLGESIASSLCTIIDDATLPNGRGSINLDDEGTPGQRTVLVENGILRSYMQDKLNAALMNQKTTGNGRRESYRYMPLPRMTNTFLAPGESTHEEIIASIDRGIYAKSFSGGQVDITSGRFVFNANQAWLIKNGKCVEPLKGVVLTGDGATVLKNISMVGNNLKMDDGVGTCGKEGQQIPVGVGQPTIRVENLTVGGTEV